jgi:RND superfamily putative drug exporter
MAMFFSPSLTALIGRRAWWPGHAAEPQAPAGQLTREAARAS